ncbi:MAG TPA: NADH-quinone oxidoreductase subunit J [Planctomycetota bacterium]|nr:NADH-quinone oxidoreductase subunit J [Planctomycetota bacterium]
MEQVFFWAFSLTVVVASLNAMLRRRPLACALSLVVSFVGLAGLYVLLGAAFPAVLQVILYAGAIMVLVVFVLMFLNLPEDEWSRRSDVKKERMWPLLLVAPLAAVLIGLVRRIELPEPAPTSPEFGSVAGVGKALFTVWSYPFELVSLLLLVAVVGAVVIAKKKLD